MPATDATPTDMTPTDMTPTDATPTDMTPTDNRDCLVCGHGVTEHTTIEGTCVGVEGMCQCHGYDPDEHPAQRLAARRDHRAVE